MKTPKTPLANRTLVCIFLRGAQDGLSLAAPAGDPLYMSSRDTTKASVPIATVNNNGTDLTGYFHLAPGAFALKSAYENNRLAFVHGVGLPNQTLSHFDGQEYMETGISPTATSRPSDVTNGWLGRFLATAPTTNGQIKGIQFGTAISRTMFGGDQTVPIPDPREFSIARACAKRLVNGVLVPQRENDLGVAYLASTGIPELVGDFGRTALTGISVTEGIDYDTDTLPGYSTGVSNTPQNSPHPIAYQLWSAAQLIIESGSGSGGFGLKSVCIDMNGWDDHADIDVRSPDILGQGFYSRQRSLCQALAAFDAELLVKGLGDSYTLVVMSEFGRRISLNGGGGFDHGVGNCWTVMGGGVNGQDVYTRNWVIPSMSNPYPDAGLASVATSNDNLAVNIDMRDLLGEILVDSCGLDPVDLPNIFPGKSSYNFLDIID